ncbi:MAG: DUF4417 domain-containing protein [Clostridiales bacterium]|nr:DUF4417 domain-containing protein [Clostridiales bacterium]
MTSKEMREDPLFMRNTFTPTGKWGIPLVRKQNIDLSCVELIACSDTKANDNAINKQKGVHFFVDDWRFTGIYSNPERTLKRYSQYKFLLTPDFSTYSDMDPWRQIESIAQNRWVGAYWQSKGLSVIPTMSWGLSPSFEFCFDGVEEGCIVAVGMVGCKKNRLGYMRGYDKMLCTVNPSAIICFGDPFPEMDGNIVSVNYCESRKVVR